MKARNRSDSTFAVLASQLLDLWFLPKAFKKVVRGWPGKTKRAVWQTEGVIQNAFTIEKSASRCDAAGSRYRAETGGATVLPEVVKQVKCG